MAKDLQRKGKKLAAQAQEQAAELAEEARAQALDALGANESHFWSNLGWLLVGAGLGALTTYMLDPDRGRRRQALVRDQMVHASKVVQREVPKKIRYAQDRLQGLQHELGLAGEGGPDGAGEDSPDWESEHNDDGSLTIPTA